MKKLCVLLATIFIFNFSAYALTENDPDTSIILDSEVVTDPTDPNNTVDSNDPNGTIDPNSEDIYTTTVDKSLETKTLNKEVKNNNLLLYIGIGVGASIVLATIGYISTKIEQKKSKKQ